MFTLLKFRPPLVMAFLSGFFFVCVVFANSFILLNLTRAVVIHTYTKVDAKFWRKPPDDIKLDAIVNPLDYPRALAADLSRRMMKAKLRSMRKQEYNAELKQRKQQAREQAQEAYEAEQERARRLKAEEAEQKDTEGAQQQNDKD